MTTLPDANDILLTAGKAPEGVDFGTAPPSSVGGRIIGSPRSYQPREYNAAAPGAGKLRTFEDGSPVLGVMVDLDVPGEGLRRLYVEKPRMLSAIRDAMVAAGAQKLLSGGFLTVAWTGTEQGAGAMPANTYAAHYAPPGPDPLAVPAPSFTAAPTPVAAAPVPAPAGSNWYQGPVPAAAAPAPAAWQAGVPGAVNGPSLPIPTPNHVPAPPVAPTAQVTAPTNVIPESIAAAMRNAGISVDGYTIVPG